MMMSPETPPSTKTSVVRKWLCSRRSSIVIILLLFLLGLFIQTSEFRRDMFNINVPNVLQNFFTVRHRGGNKNENCTSRSHIVFLKTHSTASGSVQNILYRYGESRSLTFALPLQRNHKFFYPSFFQSQFVEGVSSQNDKQFHIMCNHMRFKKSEVVKVMPQDAFYFSILRHPVTMTESMFIEAKSLLSYHDSHHLDNILKDGLINYQLSEEINSTHNNLAFDFGFENNMTADSVGLDESAAKIIQAIQQDFHLILINEYFDESLILLRHALCWSLQDVVSFRVNSCSERFRDPVSSEAAEKVKRWNALDWKIYLHFNASFWEKVRSEVGEEEMKKEVSELRELQASWIRTCLRGGQNLDLKRVKEDGQNGKTQILGYNLNRDLDQETKSRCQKLMTPDLLYTYRLYSRQFP